MSQNWAVTEGNPPQYQVVGETRKELPPDVYDIVINRNLFFVPANFSPGDIIRFSDATIDQVIADIEEFWRSRARFDKFEFPYKRGILLHGPAGTGKTCAVKLILQDIVRRGGIGIRVSDVSYFVAAMTQLRSIQPNTPVVAVMEDLDELLQNNNLSLMLNVLDGLSGFENIVYLATTNYPEELEDRVSNRPNRFDRRFEISFPNEAMREQYIVYLASKDAMVQTGLSNTMLQRWVADTSGMTLAHIRDLIISVFVYKNSYEEALGRLHGMYNPISSEQYEAKGKQLRKKALASLPAKKKTKTKTLTKKMRMAAEDIAIRALRRQSSVTPTRKSNGGLVAQTEPLHVDVEYAPDEDAEDLADQGG